MDYGVVSLLHAVNSRVNGFETRAGRRIRFCSVWIFSQWETIQHCGSCPKRYSHTPPPHPSSLPPNPTLSLGLMHPCMSLKENISGMKLELHIMLKTFYLADFMAWPFNCLRKETPACLIFISVRRTILCWPRTSYDKDAEEQAAQGNMPHYNLSFQ